MAARYLATFEHKFGNWMQEEGRFLEPPEREEMRSNVQNDEYDLARGEEYKGQPLDGTRELLQFLQSKNIDCAVTSPTLQRVLHLAAEGSIKKVLVHEVSRVARRPSVALTFVEMLEAHCVSLYWHAQSIETLLPNCKRNPAAAIMLALLSEMARAEKETLVERIKSGLAEARRKAARWDAPRAPRLSVPNCSPSIAHYPHSQSRPVRQEHG